jgi:CIC family chloride channel protein
MMKVADIMKQEYETVPLTDGLPSVREKLINAPYSELFVIDDQGKLHGTITLTDLRHAAFDPTMGDEITAGELARSKPPAVYRTDSIEKAIKLMEQTDEDCPALACDARSSFHRRNICPSGPASRRCDVVLDLAGTWIT